MPFGDQQEGPDTAQRPRPGKAVLFRTKGDALDQMFAVFPQP